MKVSTFFSSIVPIDRAFLKTFFPITFYYFLSSFVPLLDNLMIGPLGPQSISALDLGGKILFSLHVISFGVVTAISIFLVRYHKTQFVQSLFSYIRIALFVTTGLGLLISVLVLGFGSFYIHFFTSDPDVFAITSTYLKTIFWIYPLVSICSTLVVSLRSVGKPSYGVIALLGSALANIVANYALIYGNFGFPELGAQGAAWATALAYSVQLVILLLLCSRHQSFLNLFQRVLPKAQDWRIFQTIWPKIIVVMLSDSVWIFAFMVINSLFSRLDILAYSAYGVMNTILGLSFFLFVGYTSTVFIFVGRLLGQKKLEEAYRFSLKSILQMAVWSSFYGLLLLAFFPFLNQIFNLGEFSGLLKELLLRLSILFPILMVFFLLFKGILRAGGDILFVYIVEMINIWILALPSAYVAIHIFEWSFANSFFFMRLVEHLTIGLVAWRFLSKQWMKRL